MDFSWYHFGLKCASNFVHFCTVFQLHCCAPQYFSAHISLTRTLCCSTLCIKMNYWRNTFSQIPLCSSLCATILIIHITYIKISQELLPLFSTGAANITGQICICLCICTCICNCIWTTLCVQFCVSGCNEVLVLEQSCSYHGPTHIIEVDPAWCPLFRKMSRILQLRLGRFIERLKISQIRNINKYRWSEALITYMWQEVYEPIAPLCIYNNKKACLKVQHLIVSFREYVKIWVTAGIQFKTKRKGNLSTYTGLLNTQWKYKFIRQHLSLKFREFLS